ncbi:MAG TPA: hypothetical protein VF930_10370 [Stellaceae bacterium]
MAEVEVDEIRQTVERLHGGIARLAESVPVLESFEGKPVWEGVVHVFDLDYNPAATRAYAWSSPIKGKTTRRFFAVLHIPPITSPVEAIRATLVHEHLSKELRRKEGRAVS